MVSFEEKLGVPVEDRNPHKDADTGPPDVIGVKFVEEGNIVIVEQLSSGGYGFGFGFWLGLIILVKEEEQNPIVLSSGKELILR